MADFVEVQVDRNVVADVGQMLDQHRFLVVDLSADDHDAGHDADHDVAYGVDHDLAQNLSQHGLLVVDFAAADHDAVWVDLEIVHGLADAQTFGQNGHQVEVWHFDETVLKSS